MTKDDVLRITLKELINAYERAPECFEIIDKEIDPNLSTLNTTIKWSFKVKLQDEIIDDPNNASRTVILSYNPVSRQLSCSIFFREISNMHHAILSDANASVEYRFPILHKNYRQFRQLRRNILAYRKRTENDKFLNKLGSIFPSIFEDDIFGR